MAIEVQTKSKEKENLGKNIFSTICGIIIFLLIISFVYFYFIIPKIEQSIETKNREINIMKSERDFSEEEVLSYKSKIESWKRVFVSHKDSSAVFRMIEGLTHPQVWFPSLNADIEKGEIRLSGKTRSFVALGQQMIIFKKNELIKEINLSEILIDEEGISFSLFISIDSRVLQ